MHVVVAATPIAGHVGPMMQIAEHLLDCGHDVVLVTDPSFAEAAAARGVPLHGLAQDATTDDHDPQGWLARRQSVPAGVDQLNLDLIELYAAHITAQHDALQQVCTPESVLLADAGYTGAWPTLLGAPGVRPAFALGVGVTPVAVRSRDTTPLQGPVDAEPDVALEAHRAANDAFTVAMQPAQDAISAALREAGAARPVPFFFDAGYSTWDAVAQLCVAELEYPRSDLPPAVQFVGPLPVPSSATTDRPDWWPEVMGGEDEVVLVTQGTLSNADLDQLIRPTIEALAGTDVVVVVALGRDPAGFLSTAGPLPANVRVGGFLPFDELLPRVRTMVTNGGYGGTQQALRHGVPVVAAGAGEDKPFVAARVAATGAGIDLGTGTPTPGQIRGAVDATRRDPRYTTAARGLADLIRRSDALGAIQRLVESRSS